MDGRIRCQTYSWEMLGSALRGSPDDIMDAVSEAGYEGIEFSNVMIGNPIALELEVTDPENLPRYVHEAHAYMSALLA